MQQLAYACIMRQTGACDVSPPPNNMGGCVVDAPHTRSAFVAGGPRLDFLFCCCCIFYFYLFFFLNLYLLFLSLSLYFLLLYFNFLAVVLILRLCSEEAC